MAGNMAPAGFGLDGSGNVVLQDANTQEAPQTSLTGSPPSSVGAGSAPVAPGGQFEQAADVSIQTVQALNKLTQGALAPYVAAQQKKQYFDGMSQVVQGKALQDIKDEQPWYTQIFGPSATVQGAQAMTATTAVAQAQADFMNAMPELRTKSPAEVSQFLASQASSVANTGDPLVDGLVQSKIAEQWPAMLDTQIKQHYAWQQDQAGQAFVNMQASNGKLLQSTLHQMNGFSDPDQAAQQKQNFIEGLAKPYGMTDEAYGKYMAQSAQVSLSGGNFEAYEALKANPDAWNAIPANSRVQLENEEELYTQKALKNSPALSGVANDKTKLQLALLQGVYPGDEASLNQTIDQLNADAQAKTGSSIPVLNNNDRDMMLKAYYMGRNKIANAANKANNDLLSDQSQRGFAMGAYTAGSSAAMPHGVTEENAQLAAEEFWTNGKNAAASDPSALDNTVLKLAQTSDDSKLRPKSLTVQLQQDMQNLFVTGGNVTDRQQQSLLIAQKMLATPNGPQALSNYLGSADLSKKVQAFIGSGVDINDPKGLETTRTWIKNGSGATANQADIKAATNYISGQDPGFFKHYLLPVFGGAGELSSFSLNDATKQKMATDLAPYIAMTQKAYNMDPQSAAQFAYGQVYGNLNNTDFIDGTVVAHNPYIHGAQSLYQGVRALPGGGGINQTTDDYQNSVKEVAHTNLKSAVVTGIAAMNKAHVNDATYVPGDINHFDPNDFNAVGGEQVGGGVLMLYYQNKKDGRMYPTIVRPDQVIAAYKARVGANRSNIENGVDAAMNNYVTQNGAAIYP